MMRSDVRTTPVESPVAAFREAFPLGSTNQVVAVDEDGRYAGMVMVAEAHATELPATKPVRAILHHADHMVVPQMTAQEAVAAFDSLRSGSPGRRRFNRAPAGDRAAERSARAAPLSPMPRSGNGGNSSEKSECKPAHAALIWTSVAH